MVVPHFPDQKAIFSERRPLCRWKPRVPVGSSGLKILISWSMMHHWLGLLPWTQSATIKIHLKSHWIPLNHNWTTIEPPFRPIKSHHISKTMQIQCPFPSSAPAWKFVSRLGAIWIVLATGGPGSRARNSQKNEVTSYVLTILYLSIYSIMYS